MFEATIARDVVVWSLLGLLGWAAWSDYRRLLIPNRICVAIVALFAVYLPFSPLPMTEAAWSLGVAFVVFAFGAFLFARRMIGGGDVKLLAAVALWAGRDLVFDYLFITTLAGGVLAVAMIAPARLAALFPGMLRFVPAGSGGGSGAPRGSTQPSLPYGIAIAAGGIYVALTIGGQ